MRWTRVTAVVFALLCSARLAYGQASTGRVAGAVLEEGTSAPLPSVSVIVVGTRIGVLSGGDGRFLIPGMQPGSYTLRAMALGYANAETQVQVVGGQTAQVSFRLEPQAVKLNEVVAIGYGSTRKRDLTGAVSSVKMDALERAPIASVDQVLAGTSPGVFVTQASSAPGGGISIRIRGAGSITGNSEPLYVLDGFPIENDIEGLSVGNGGRANTVPFNPLSVLDPSDIESVQVLKDASATAIYGARGANGVVMITTRTGRGAKPTVTFDLYTGIQSVAKRYDLLDALGYMDFANATGANNSTPFTPFPERAACTGSNFNTTACPYANTDWQSLVYRTAPMRNFQMTVTGATSGANRTRYAVSAGYFNQDGIVVGSAFNRLSGRVNLDQQIGNRLTVATSLTAARTRTTQIPTDGAQNGNAGVVAGALQYQPTLPVQKPDGTYTLELYDTPNLLGPADIPNPVSMTYVQDDLGDTRLLGNAYAQYEIFKGLTAKVSLGGDYSSRFRNTYYPLFTERGQQNNGDALRASTAVQSWLNENTLTYHRMWGDVHDLTVLGGFTRQAQELTGENINNSQFVSDATGYDDIGAGTQTGGPSVGSRYSKWTMESFLGRVNYSLKGRYLFTATARRDGSSRFGSDQKWGNFPSAAFAWRISDEPFLKNHVPSISELKLRTSYGTTGNPSIRPYQSLARLCDQGYSFGGTQVGGYYPCGVANSALTWESTRQADAGVDLNMFEDRLRITADWYNKKTTNLLLQVQLDPITGYTSALQNRGSVQNRGYELSVGYDLIRAESKRGFNWSTEIDFARNTNKVLDLGCASPAPGDTTTPPPCRIYAATISNDYKFPGSIVQVGQPIGVFFGYATQGILRDSAALKAYNVVDNTGRPFRLGDMAIVDANHDGQINQDDRIIIGDPTPKFTFGWQNSFSYKAVQLTALFQGVYGNKILNVNLARSLGSARGNVLAARWLDSWTPEKPNAKYARVGDDPVVIASDFTDQMLEDGSYVRLRTATLSFDLPKRWVQAPGLSNARAYISGANLFTLTHYMGFNPDVSSLGVGNTNRGVDIGAYPIARTFTFGLSVTY